MLFFCLLFFYTSYFYPFIIFSAQNFANWFVHNCIIIKIFINAYPNKIPVIHLLKIVLSYFVNIWTVPSIIKGIINNRYILKSNTPNIKFTGIARNIPINSPVHLAHIGKYLPLYEKDLEWLQWHPNTLGSHVFIIFNNLLIMLLIFLI